MPKFNVGEFDSWFFDHENFHRPLNAEMRSNAQLYAGDHYARKVRKVTNQLERNGNRNVPTSLSIRITKNHVQRICKIYKNNILSQSPAVRVEANNESETADVKAAKLDGSVWDDFLRVNKYSKTFRDHVHSFVTFGEIWQKINWEPEKQFLGMSTPPVDQFGIPVGEPEKLFRGGFVVERLFPYDVFTDKNAVSFEESEMVGIQKMVPTSRLKKQFPKFKTQISETPESTFKIWNTVTNTSEDNAKGMTLFREMYVRPSADYPKGYFIFGIQGLTLAEGDLPEYDGKPFFPIQYKGWDEIEKSARSRSPIKVLRPYQAEINRASSKQVEHHVTVGDDKVFIQAGSKVTANVTMPGVRAYTVNGPPPTIVPGRTGDQFTGYIASMIDEMYKAGMVQEDTQEKSSNSQDAYAMLYRSIKQKKYLSTYTDKILEFLTETCETVLMIAREEYDDNQAVRAIGRSEMVNISEFKSSSPLNTQIKVVEKSGDLDTDFAKQMAFQHILQFIGNSLKPEQIAMIIKSMPFLKQEKVFAKMTIDADIAENIILALDRGEEGQPPTEFQNHKEIINQLNHRVKQPDFRSLEDQIQQSYMSVLKSHEAILQQQLQAMERAKQGQIPSDGGLVTINMSAPNPETGSNRRISLPSGSLEWLISKLQEQGRANDQFFGEDGLASGSQARIANSINSGGGQEKAPQEQPQEQGQPGGSLNFGADALPNVGGQGAAEQ